MKIVLAYIAVANGSITEDYAARFVSSWLNHPPGVFHDTIIVCNGGLLKTETALLFSSMKPLLYPRKNDPGYDISAYIELARCQCAKYDMMLCFGESVYFHREGWLKRLVEAWERHGPGLYGPFGSNVLRTHLQTTAFCCSPVMLAQYPKRVASRRDRYEFEHGERSFWRQLDRRGVPVRLVTWDGEWQPRDFRLPKNGMWRGDQSNLLMFCNHSDHYRDADETRKAKWSKSIDRAFR